MLDAINRLKYNRSLLKKKSYFTMADAYRNAQIRAGLTYKKATPEELQKLRRSIIEKHRREAFLKVVSMIVSVLIFIGLVWIGDYCIEIWFG